MRSGAFVNCDLGEYLVPVHADIPAIDAVMLDGFDDRRMRLASRVWASLGSAARFGSLLLVPIIDSYWRAGTLNISYASAAPDRPGIGSFTLRPMYPGLAEKAVTYAGLALVHECECQVTSALSTGQEQQGVTPNGPMLIVPAVLTSERVLRLNVAASFFVKNPVRPDIIWPSDIMKTANAKSR